MLYHKHTVSHVYYAVQCTALHCTYYGLTTAWYQSITPWTESKAPTTVFFSHHVPLHGICNSVWSPHDRSDLHWKTGGKPIRGRKSSLPPYVILITYCVGWDKFPPTPCLVPPFLDVLTETAVAPTKGKSLSDCCHRCERCSAKETERGVQFLSGVWKAHLCSVQGGARTVQRV